MEIKKYYSESHNREMLELSDNHVDWQLGDAIEHNCNGEKEIERAAARYDVARYMYIKKFENHYNVRLCLCGRSGRHVCVEDTAENRRRYTAMRDAVDIMQKLIVAVAVDNDKWVGDTVVFFGKMPRWVSGVHREAKREINERIPAKQ